MFKVGGDSVQASYNNQSKQNTTTITTVAAGGKLVSKQIYFVPWQPNSDEALLCESLKKFISESIEKAVSESYQSIAFPAIGCGQFGCSISLVAKTLVDEAYRIQATHPIAVSFVIQTDRTDIYDAFQNQIDSLKKPQKPLETPVISMATGNGIIVVEKGNITTQKVLSEEQLLVHNISFILFLIGRCYYWKFIIRNLETDHNRSSWYRSKSCI